ncbi:MAG TPA: hypothetical protein DEQ74_02605 [Wolbachia sp.]|nr:hypothetical protein [Wolbachia sp.]
MLGVFVSLEEDYQDEWEFFDLLRRSMNYKGFKQACAGKSFSKNFRECIDKYIKLANQAEKVASKYFGKKNVKLQAYYTEVENTYRVLNINLINYNRSEPIGISDILQQEKDTNELNIYCNKKHEIHAYRKGKERHYKFKEGVRYEMTSTWYVQDKSGSTAMCTMIMNISNNGITEILQFNGENFVPSEKILELIKQNDELYIQELPLHGAVMRFLESSKAASKYCANC